MVKNNGIWKVGELSYRVIKLLGLSLQEGSPIYIGKENIKHIKKSHLRDFQKYGKDINKIISYPPDFRTFIPNMTWQITKLHHIGLREFCSPM